ncbi:MAG: hypothetical protein AB7N80_05315 [Bdellovibrionales bacterium]
MRPNNKSAWCWLLATLLLQTACASTVLVKDPTAFYSTKVERTHHIALFGFWEVSDPVPLNQLCSSDWNQVETVFTPVNVILGVVTLGLYTPATVRVSCKANQSRR